MSTPIPLFLLLVGSNFLKMNQAVCDRRALPGRGWRMGVRKDGASQHLGKIPVGWEGEAFPRSSGLSGQPFS